MKKVIYIILLTFLSLNSYGRHITGGEIYYTYLGKSAANPAKLSYKITLLLYKDTTVSGTGVASLGGSYPISVFRGDNNLFVLTVTAVRTNYEYMNLSNYNPCLNTKPAVKYAVATYEATIDLDPLAEGYFVSHSQCCRINGINNIISNNIGATYWVKIPGSIDNPFAPDNSNAVFNKRDTILVCRSSPLNIDFSAIDPDNDVLVYKLTNGYIGASSTTPVPANSDPPPFISVDYIGSYTAQRPLDAGVSIDANTGIVTGIAPATTGVYLIAVLVEEYRNGIKISEHRKDFQIRVDDCTLTGAALKPSYITCNGTTLSFQNESTSTNIISYLWDFGVPSLTTDTSSNPTPSYDYLQSGKDSGTYKVKLKVTAVGGCQDSAISLVKVYPGFAPNFTINGTCYLNNYQFFDATTTKYGAVNSWAWNFGDNTTLADTAHSKDSAWKYPAAATAQVRLIVTNSKGCIDSITKPLTILDKPILNLPFRDTLICSIDTLALKVNINSGSVLWTPANGPNKTRILNAATTSPLVFPKDTTKYYVSVNDNGCANTDSVNVNVLQFISVKAGVDTGICKTDTIRLHPVSDALNYQWTASTGELVQHIKNPLVQPLSNTQYLVVANLGKCQAKDSFLVKVAPYPNAAAGADVTICYGSRVQLNGSITGSVFFWRPVKTLINENTLTPVAGPTSTTSYILTATDTVGCPKAKTDTIVVTVIPPIYANAGSDTFAVPEEPLQLNASGGSTYFWTPATGLSNPTIANPIATLSSDIDSVTYTVRASIGSCYSEDKVVVKVYKNGPDIVVPSAFTPNGDGKNDISKPIVFGITKLNYFSIYNRWGQMVFTTNELNKGWDGNFGGTPQPAGTFVYQAEGVDYKGRIVFRKGTLVLIR